jgi:phytoene/squalene synthetase
MNLAFSALIALEAARMEKNIQVYQRALAHAQQEQLFAVLKALVLSASTMRKIVKSILRKSLNTS